LVQKTGYHWALSEFQDKILCHQEKSTVWAPQKMKEKLGGTAILVFPGPSALGDAAAWFQGHLIVDPAETQENAATGCAPGELAATAAAAVAVGTNANDGRNSGSGGNGGTCGGNDEDERIPMVAANARQQQPRTLTLLGVHTEIDACLQCCQGGYQHFTMRLTDRREHHREVAVLVEKRGGDLAALRHVDRVPYGARVPDNTVTLDFAPDVLKTDGAMMALVRKYFPKLLNAAGEDPERTLADTIIVAGRMTVGGIDFSRGAEIEVVGGGGISCGHDHP
jgi:hypothetical protein